MTGSRAQSTRTDPGAGGSTRETIWELARRQHGLVTYAQLVALGLSRHAIAHRVERGRLHRVRLGVFTVGRPTLTQHARWLAAVLGCGTTAALSHADAGALYRILPPRPGPIHVSIAQPLCRRVRGLVIHRRWNLDRWTSEHQGVPVTAPALTLVDMAGVLAPAALESAVNEADALDLIDPESLRNELEALQGRAGVAALRALLDRSAFRLTDSELERRFLGLVRDAGLPIPETQVTVNGWRVDFFWPRLELVVETDGLRYHRTAAKQARDRLRDQAHAAAGMTALRFTHAQVRFEPSYVRALLVTVARRLVSASGLSERSSRS